MTTQNVTILVWDENAHFHDPQTQRDFGGTTVFKAVKNFHSLADFTKLMEELGDDDPIVVCCHVKFKDFSGYQEFTYSGIIELYYKLQVTYLSTGHSGDVMKQLREKFSNSISVITYHDLITKIKHDEIIPTSKGEIQITQKNGKKAVVPIGSPTGPDGVFPQVDFAIITALYKDEFEQVKQFIDFPETEIISTEKKQFRIGYLKSDRTIKVVAGIPSATGMVDAAIIATQMLELFKPKYLLMAGVCAGSSDLNFGDIVVAKQLFTFQKGKISDVRVKSRRKTKLNKPALFDRHKNPVDYDHLYDAEGNQIVVDIHRFQVEHDTMIDLHPLLKDQMEAKRADFELIVNNKLKPFNRKVDIYIEPMACSTMVINKEGYFESKIKTINRKTVAVEMESYGVARACEFGNNGKTKPIIFKSVMDHGANKSDQEKSFAAYTSAAFLNCLLESGILK